jgi:PTH1 family peptidyl-tRNA hydrolase
VVDRLAARHGAPKWKRRGGRLEAAVTIGGFDVRLVKPGTYMNRSGVALGQLRREEPFEPEELLVCYDEIDLPLGRLRLRPAGSHAGHNGVRSIIETLGSSDFPRLRVGVAPTSGGYRDAAEFVLRPFRRHEQEEAALAEERAADAVEMVLTEGLTASMNRYNPEPTD